MLVLFAVIVVDVGGNSEFAEGSEAFFDALVFRAIGQEGMADIEIEAEAGEARFVDESAEVGGIAHLAGGVLDGDGDTGVMGVQYEMLERAEGSIALARVGCFARTTHVEY